MWWLYLDESGDLGFDFVNKNPSRHFTVCVLATSDRTAFNRINKSVRKTLTRKLKKPKDLKASELKGSKTSLDVKKYFYRQIAGEQFAIYAVTINKLRVYENLAREKERVYNWVARLVLDRIPMQKAATRVQLVLDKSKTKREIVEFNKYIMMQVGSRLDPAVPLDISHLYSHEDRVLQATDMFCWGIYRKYEKRDLEWYSVFQEKIASDVLYLK